MDSDDAPLPIYKRPKDDNESNSNPKEAIPDLKLFKNMEVAQDDAELTGPAMKRLMATLNYYNSLMVKDSNSDFHSEFIEFCDSHYGQQWMMEDYIHFVTNHNDMESLNKLAATLEWKGSDDLKQCGAIRRHFRDRESDHNDDDKAIHFYTEIMDTVHVNVLRLVDVGLRVKMEWNPNDEQSQKLDGLVDERILEISKQIQSKRQQLTSSVPRFVLRSEEKVSSDIAMDRLYDDFAKKIKGETSIQNLVQFVNDERFDTETMDNDVAIYREERDSNLLMALKGDSEAFGVLREFLRIQRVSEKTFSTGIWWTYWHWYRSQERLTGHQWSGINFGGHPLKDLCVIPQFRNLKEEVLESGFLTMKQFNAIYEKTTILLKTLKCKKMKSNNNGEALKYEIPRDSSISPHHLCVVMLFCDFPEFRAALIATFSPLNTTESIGAMNKRNAEYFWTSRYLREVVSCFGQRAVSCYVAMTDELYIPQFQIGLLAPTSGYGAVGVAMYYAGNKGMVMGVKGGGYGNQCLDTSWIGAFPEKQEKVFCGSIDRQTVTSIVMMNTAKNYKTAVTAYSKFDAIFSGQKVEEMSALDLEIIKESIRWIGGGEDAVNHKKLDLFILESFYSLILHKKTVYLNLGYLHRVKENEIINLAMNPMWESYGGGDSQQDIPKDANLLKPFVFSLFRHLQVMRISAMYTPFDLLSFLRMLQSADLPETLRLIIIEDRYDWVQKAFDKVKEEYNAANIEYEMVNGNSLYLKLYKKFWGFQ